MYEELREAYGGKYPFGCGFQPQDDEASYPLYPPKPAKEYEPHPATLYTATAPVSPPDDFRLKPMDPKKAPKPTAAETLPQPYTDSEVFKDVDAHAVEVTAQGFSSIKDLLWNLIFACNITNETEKARVIFRWLCQNDPKSLNFTDFPSDRESDTHSTVFQVLCQNAGLHCHLIRGYVKLSSRKPGSAISGNENKHTWNAVYVDNTWRFVDCCWASRIETGTKHFPGRTKKKFDDFYFMTPPQLLCITHFPDDPKWQLMSKPFTKKEFEQHVYLSAHFSHYALKLLSHKNGVIPTKDDVTVCIGFPPERIKAMNFMFSFEFDSEGDLMRSHQLNRLVQYHRTLNGCGMQEQLDNVAYFTIRPPEKGSYRLIIYAKDVEKYGKEEKFQSVCNYEIKMEGTTGLPKFPPCANDCWGPNNHAKEQGITLTQLGAVIKNSDGWLDLKFNVTNEVDFQAKMKNVDKDERELEEYMAYRYIDQIATYTITFPKAGEYGLEIYANHAKGSGEKLKHIAQYLIQATSATAPEDMLPSVPTGFLGPKTSFKQLGISTVSHPDPIIKLDINKFDVVLHSKQDLNYSANLVYISHNKHEDKSENLFRQGQGEKIVFVLNLPKSGWYRFEVYAVNKSSANQRLPNVFNYLINCQRGPATVPLPYPKQYTSWRGDCYLFEPQEGMRPGLNHFKVRVPDAEAVALIVDGSWNHLRDENGIWRGDIEIKQRPGKQMIVNLSAKFPEQSGTFSTLLQYTLRI